MEDKKPTLSHRMKNYSTVFSRTINFLFTIMLLSIASWFLLVMWFIGRLYLQSNNDITGQVDLLAQSHILLIPVYASVLLSKITTYLDQIKPYIQLSLMQLLDCLNDLFHKINYQTTLSSQHLSACIAVLIDGTFKIIIYRFLLFITNLPLFICLQYVLLVDGLGQRDIRKFKGSRESTFFFHRIKPLTGKIFFILFLMYMSAPFVFPLDIALAVIVLIFSIMTMLTVKSYKKYL